MSRRVSEPSPQRRQAQGVWGVEDLRKRPAPEVAAGGGGDLPWIVLKDIATGQLFAAGAGTVIIYQEVVNDYTATFSTTTGFGGTYRVDVLEDGLYSCHFHMPLDELNVGAHSIDVLQVDPSSGGQYDRGYYQGAQSATGPMVNGCDGWNDVVRLAAGQSLWSVLHNNTGAAINSRNDGGAFFEVRKLGDATTGGRDRDTAG